MNRCLGCGGQLAANARFCSLCGKEVVQPTLSGQRTQTGMPTQQGGAPLPPPPNYSRYPTQQPTGHYGTGQYPAGPYPATQNDGKKKVAIAAGIGTICAAIALLLILKAAGVLGAKPTEVATGTVLTAPQTKPIAAPVLTAPKVTPPSVAAPVLAPPPNKDNPMPEDVVAYLRWLKQFEAARRAMEYKGISAYMKVPVMLTQQMMNEFDEDKQGQPKGRNQVADEIGDVVQKLSVATSKFQGYPPPNPCGSLALAYQNALTVKTQQMSQLQGVVTQIFASIDSSGNSNSKAQEMLPQLMQEMQNKSMSKESDAADTAASQALNALRAQYTSMPADVRDFDIAPVNTGLDPKTVIPPGLGFGGM